MRWWWGLLCTTPTHLALWNNSLQIDMLPHLDILSWFWANSSLLFLLYVVYLVEKQQMPNFVIFGLTRSGLQTRIYHTRGDHVNHYTTDAVDDFFFYKVKISTKYEKIILKLFVLDIALATQGTSLSVIREITLTTMRNFRIKSGMCQRFISLPGITLSLCISVVHCTTSEFGDFPAKLLALTQK